MANIKDITKADQVLAPTMHPVPYVIQPIFYGRRLLLRLLFQQQVVGITQSILFSGLTYGTTLVMYLILLHV